MKSLAIYWISGCLMVGLVIGKGLEWCPDDRMPMSDAIISVALWPAIIVGASVAPRGNRTCNDGTAFRQSR